LTDRGGFDGVADGSALSCRTGSASLPVFAMRRTTPTGHMCFYVWGITRIQARAVVTLVDQVKLCLERGSSDGLGFSILVHQRFADHRSNWITILQGLVERLEDDGRNAFATTVAIGSVVPSEALSVRTEDPAAFCQPIKSSKIGYNLRNITRGLIASQNCPGSA